MATEGVQVGGQTASLNNFEFVKFEFFFIWDCVGLKRVTEKRDRSQVNPKSVEAVQLY